MRGVLVLLATGCASTAPTPRTIRASVVWEHSACVTAPGHTECGDGYVISKCDDSTCDCEIHARWTGDIIDTSAGHEFWHCMQDAAGVNDPMHTAPLWAMKF